MILCLEYWGFDILSIPRELILVIFIIEWLQSFLFKSVTKLKNMNDFECQAREENDFEWLFIRELKIVTYTRKMLWSFFKLLLTFLFDMIFMTFFLSSYFNMFSSILTGGQQHYMIGTEIVMMMITKIGIMMLRP